MWKLTPWHLQWAGRRALEGREVLGLDSEARQ